MVDLLLTQVFNYVEVDFTEILVTRKLIKRAAAQIDNYYFILNPLQVHFKQ